MACRSKEMPGSGAPLLSVLCADTSYTHTAFFLPPYFCVESCGATWVDIGPVVLYPVATHTHTAYTHSVREVVAS